MNWDPTAPVVQVLSLHENWNKAKISLSVFNPHDKSLPVSVLIEDAWHRNPPRTVRQTLELKPGEKHLFKLEPPDGGPKGLHYAKVLVTDPKGEKTYYFRQFRWSLHRPENVWKISEEERHALDVKFKYYPYYNKIRLYVSIESQKFRDKVRSAIASIASGKKTYWSKLLRFEKYLSENYYDIPEFPDGTYTLSVQLRGAKEVTVEPYKLDFVRKHYEWEHNRLGISDEVMPPFTPLEVEGNTVRCVLREHTHGPAGMWSQLKSEGRELLSAPMSWEVVEGSGRSLEVRAKGWKCKSRKPTEVIGEAKWSAGPLRAVVRTVYDYDGMMLVTLILRPTGKRSISRLTLNIPLRESEARYMHAVGDSLRYNYAGFTPEGRAKSGLAVRLTRQT